MAVHVAHYNEQDIIFETECHQALSLYDWNWMAWSELERIQKLSVRTKMLPKV